MAFNPLQERMNAQGDTPAARGMSASEAQNAIAGLLDDDGRTYDHKEEGEARGESGEHEQQQNVDDQLDDQVDDQNSGEDQGTDDGDTGQPEGDEGADDAEETTGQDDQAADDDEEGGQLETLAEWAEALEMEPDELLASISHTFKAAGEDRTATLADIIAGYRLQADYDRDKTAMAEQRRNFETEQQARVEQYQQNANVLANQFMLVENTIAAQLQDPKLIQLQTDDPAQFVMRQREIETQLNNLRAARQQAAEQYNQFMEHERNEFMKAEGTKLAERVEDWGDDKLRAAVDTIKTLGYSDDEVPGVVDSRLIIGALELAQLRTENAALKARIEKGEKAAGTVKKQVPKGIKPGRTVTKKSGRGPDKSAVSKLRRRAAQTNTVQDAASVIEALME